MTCIVAGVSRPLRFPNYDYATPGAYFITIITNERVPLLGAMDETTGSICPSPAGRMVDRWWLELTQKFPSLTLDARVLMPDHFHGLLLLNCEPRVDPCSVFSVVQWFKTMTTAEYFRGVRDGRWTRVNSRLWQRGFHDHVVRGETELECIRRYIEGNPGRLWELTHPIRADT